MSDSPTSRTLEWCRAKGWPTDVTERWLPKARVRKDLFGFIDVVALDGLPGVHGFQCTSTDNMSHREAKIGMEPLVTKWIQAGNRLSIIGWALRGAAGKRKLWTLRIRRVYLNFGDLTISTELVEEP